MSKQLAVLDAEHFRYIVSPLKPGNQCTLQDVFKAIKNTTQLKWLEIAQFAGLANANRAFRVAYLQKDRDEMKALEPFLVIDAGENCAYFYHHDHKPAQVTPPHVGPTIVSNEAKTQTVTAGVPSLFATRVVISDPLNRYLKMTLTPTGGYLITDDSNAVYDTDVTFTVGGHAKALNQLLDTMKFVGRGKGAAQIVIAIDDGAGQSASVTSITLNFTVEEGKTISTPELTAGDQVSGVIGSYAEVNVTVADTDNKMLAVRFSPFNCQLYGFRSWANILGDKESHTVQGVPKYINQELDNLTVMPLAKRCSIGVELTCGSFYVSKYITVNATEPTDTDTDEEEEDIKSEPVESESDETVQIEQQPQQPEAAQKVEAASAPVETPKKQVQATPVAQPTAQTEPAKAATTTATTTSNMAKTATKSSKKNTQQNTQPAAKTEATTQAATKTETAK